MTADRRTLLIFLPLVLLLGAMVWKESRAAPPQREVFEYKVLTWTAEDTGLVLRKVSGDDTSRPNDIVRDLADRIEPRDNPALQAAVDRRLAARLAKEGQEGWEAFWVRDTTTILEGYVLPAPSVLLRRRKQTR